MTTTRAAGRTITAGELIEHFGQLDPNEPIRLSAYGDEEPIEEIDGETICGPSGDHVYQSAHELLEELHEFTGTKKALLKAIADYVEGN
jgi:hypothetical protein